MVRIKINYFWQKINKMKRLVAPSLLASDFGNLRNDIQMVNDSKADWFHCDIMDGVFVPNISFGFPILKHIKKYSKRPLDVHLMIVEPEKYILQECRPWYKRRPCGGQNEKGQASKNSTGKAYS